MTQTLFPRFADIIRNTAKFDLTNLSTNHPLLIDQFADSGCQVQMLYAPFDHINLSARIAIIGMTPGAHQANQALLAAQTALQHGKPDTEAASIAKGYASFSGEPMRTNLIRMMDRIGIAQLLDIKSTQSLWAEDNALVHFTSALRYPVFVDGNNWSGTPDIIRTAKLREWLLAWTGAELAQLSGCILVPLGPKVAAAMHYMASQGAIDAAQIMDGMPHPSGANQERVAFFLGDKPAELCSIKTNPAKLELARKTLVQRIARCRIG